MKLIVSRESGSVYLTTIDLCIVCVCMNECIRVVCVFVCVCAFMNECVRECLKQIRKQVIVCFYIAQYPVRWTVQRA